MSIELQNDVAIPDPRVANLSGSKRGPPFKYPWPDMKAPRGKTKGDSFFVATPEGKSIDRHQSALGDHARRYAGRQGDGAVFETRRVVEGGVSGVRVWRVR
jgi:hypothetical protein